MGTQELGRRGGTENTAAIHASGVAAREAMEWLQDDGARARCAALRDRLERALVERCDGVVNGAAAERLWNTTNVGFAGLEAEAILILLSERGVLASAGAACSSGSLDPSPVLLAMGVEPKVAHGSVRFSIGRETTEGEIEKALEVIVESVVRLRGSWGSVRK
jgi:cysteine desulfurase